jgi:hypothetical protein
MPRALRDNSANTIGKYRPNRGGLRPGFKLERKLKNRRWRWVNRRQAFTQPLFYLEPGEKGESEPLVVYFGTPEARELKPGLYRATKSLQLTSGEPRPPTMDIRVNFRMLAQA